MEVDAQAHLGVPERHPPLSAGELECRTARHGHRLHPAGRGARGVPGDAEGDPSLPVGVPHAGRREHLEQMDHEGARPRKLLILAAAPPGRRPRLEGDGGPRGAEGRHHEAPLHVAWGVLCVDTTASTPSTLR